mmetsp:Transcript_39519/g.125370  ORF Transcript_39519/g.125370 Transcript_39519/m.125370 type:complete len:285 (-) Transcript_39519:150-1004(-)
MRCAAKPRRTTMTAMASSASLGHGEALRLPGGAHGLRPAALACMPAASAGGRPARLGLLAKATSALTLRRPSPFSRNASSWRSSSTTCPAATTTTRSAEDPTTRDEHEPRRNEEYASDDIAEDLCECDEAPGKFLVPVDIDKREFMPDCDDDFATEGVLHDLLAISLFDDLRDRDEYRSQCGEEHGKYLVDDVDEIEDRCDEIVEDRRCALYGEGPLEILQFGNSFFSVTDALQSSVVSRTCQRGISSLWVSPQKKWSEVLRRLEDSFERFEEMLLGDAADGGA